MVFINFLKQFFLERDFIYFQREGTEGRDRERNIDVQEKHQLFASCTPPMGNLASNPGMCPGRESKRQPLCSQASAQSTEPSQPGLCNLFNYIKQHYTITQLMYIPPSCHHQFHSTYA